MAAYQEGSSARDVNETTWLRDADAICVHGQWKYAMISSATALVSFIRSIRTVFNLTGSHYSLDV